MKPPPEAAQVQPALQALAGIDAEPWPEADELFRSDPHWLGSDDAYSIDLGDGRVLWLFGDTFITYDTRTKTLFTSDLFGSLSRKWDLYAELAPECEQCPDYEHCPNGRDYCPLPDILDFHRQVMPTARAVRMAMETIRGLDVEILAPQHGSVFARRSDIDFLCRMLAGMDRMGIDERAGG